MDHFSVAVAAHRSGDLALAALRYRAAIKAGPNPAAMVNLASILRQQGEMAEAEQLFRKALELDPARPVARLNLANLLWRLGRLTEAEALYRSLPDLPEACVNLGCVLLALGRDEEGWAWYDRRPERVKALAHPLSFAEWRGEPLSGKRLLVRPEQGFGDQILAARWLAGLEGQVTCYVRAPLVRLYRSLGVDTRPIGADEVDVEPHDYWVLPLSLPRWGRPAPGPWLAAAPRRTGARIGVAWQGNAEPDPLRSMSRDQAERLLALPGAISLQPEDTGARDFLETAEIIAGLDRVISIDTSIAHLAGAMGKPTCVLLHAEAWDWRWRETDPFYPAVRILRQPRRGDWAALVDTLSGELA